MVHKYKNKQACPECNNLVNELWSTKAKELVCKECFEDLCSQESWENLEEDYSEK